MIYCFGDSWGEGYELDFAKGERPFVYHLSKELNLKFKNLSVSGNAYPVIVTQVFNAIQDVMGKDNITGERTRSPGIQKDDIVLIVIPPDIRWMDERDKRDDYQGVGGFRSWSMGTGDLVNRRYVSWLGQKTRVWFRYHASLFTYAIQSALDSIGCRYLFMHNYGGEFTIDHHFKFLINTDNFLNINKSLTTLLGGKDEYEAWNLKFDGPQVDLQDDKYFEGTRGHPNELGHKRIAELIKEKI